MYEYISKNLVYPEKAIEQNITGSVVLTFIVERDGRVSNVKVLKGIGGGCDEEAVRVVSAMPRWEPGRANGKNVRVRHTLPIFFQLEDD